METFNKGLNTDAPIKLQPQGTYRFALNGMLETTQGDYSSMSSEVGTELCVTLEDNLEVIGSVTLDDNEVVVFATNESTSAILLVDMIRCEYTTLVNDPALNFSTLYPVDAIFRIRRGCDRIVYFTDTNNPYRIINIDRMDDYFTAGIFDVDSINYTPTLDVPRITGVEILEGSGELLLGSYSFTIRYLDANRTPTDWFYVTQTVNIYDDNINSPYNSIDGGLNLIDSTEELGAVPPSNKAIQLNIDSIDPSYAYYQIGVIPSINNTASPTQVYIMNEVEISSAEDSTVITSLNNPGTITDSLNDVSISKININKVQAHEQTLNRLFLAGIESKNYNWLEFQQAANNIEVNWVSKAVAVQDAGEDGDPKNPATPFEYKTAMADEVCALSVAFLFNDGSFSPAFHIPGRVATQNDVNLLPLFTLDEAEYAHVPSSDIETINGVDFIQTWKLYNTATAGGDTAYYEVDTEYPSTECDGQRVFPEGNIRHHRMIDRRKVPTFFRDEDDQLFINILGWEFSNVTYPHPDIVGHVFLSSKRSSNETTVIDNGVVIAPIPANYGNNNGVLSQGLINTLSVADIGVFHLDITPNPTDTTNFRLWTPKFLTNFSSLRQTSYVRFLRQLTTVDTYDSFEAENLQSSITPPSTSSPYTILRYGDGSSYDYPGPNSSWFIESREGDFSAATVGGPTIPSFENRNIEFLFQYSPRSIDVTVPEFNGENAENRSVSNPVLMGGFSHEYSGFFNQSGSYKIYMVSAKKNVKPYSNLETIQYYPLNSSYLTLSDDQIAYGKEAYVTNFNIYDIAAVNSLEIDDIINPHISADYIYNIYVDSAINFDLIHSGDIECNSRYKLLQENPIDYIATKTLYQEDPGVSAWRVNPTICAEYYGYNKDYSRVDSTKTYFSLNSDNTICSSCLDKYPNRIYYSEQSFQEEISDAYRNILVNNYIDVDASLGPIVQLAKNKDKLYCFTTKAPFFVPTSPQRLTSNEDNIFVGTGDVLSIPPAALSSTKSGYGGMQDKFAMCQTEFGLLYVDSLSRRIFMLSDGLEEISSKGLSNFFDETLSLELKDSLYKDLGERLVLSAQATAGFRLAYDPKYRRVILHKRDYKPRNPIQLTQGATSYDTSTAYYVPNLKEFRKWNNQDLSFDSVDFTDGDVFENKSYTISYSLEFGAWASFHSYFPDWMSWDNISLISTKGSAIYKHEKNNFQTYYEESYPHIVEVILNDGPAQDKVFGNLQLVSKAFIQDSNTNDYYASDYLTFNRMWAYNDRQSTGLQNIQVKKDNTFFDDNAFPSIVAIHQSDNTWTLNSIRNYYAGNNSTSVASKAWDDIRNNYFIDKVPNSIDLNISQFNQSRMRDKYMAVRLYFDQSIDTNYRITTDMINTKYKPSFR